MEQLSSYPGINLQSIPIYLLLLLISTLRIGAFLLSSPFFGSRMVPLPVRIVFSFGIGIWVLNNIKMPSLAILVSSDLLPIVLQELFIGLTCGLTLAICFGAVILAGEKIAATSGLAFASQIDPTNGAQSPVISQIFSLFLLVLFFSLNGHLVIFKLLFNSYEGMPIGGVVEYKNMIKHALTSAGFLFRTAVMIVLPIVSILFFMNLGVGFITKSAPQLNLFSFGFPMTILGTFFALYFSVDALQFVFGELIDDALGIIKVVLESVANGGK